MIFTGIFCVLFLTTSTFLYLSVKRNLEFLEQQENLLELFDSSLQELELFSDDAIVKELVADIKKTRDAVATLIEKLTNEKDIIKNIEDDV